MGNSAEVLYSAIKDMIDMSIKESGFARYFSGNIISRSGDNYSVKINGQFVSMKARTGTTFAVGDIVLICAPDGNLSNAFIDMKRTN